MAVPDWIWFVFIFAFGCCIGSFLNVVIYRMPRDKSIVSPPSACPSCGEHIRFYDNIPLISWLVLGRKCRFCKAPVSPRYFVIELLTGLVFLGLFIIYFKTDLLVNMPKFSKGGWLIYLLHIILLGAFIAASAIDLELWIIPLSICWFVTIAGLIGSTAGAMIIEPDIIVGYGLLPVATAGTGALAAGAAIGLAISLILLVSGLLKRSYEPDESQKKNNAAANDDKTSDNKPDLMDENFNHRLEALREIIFLLPIIAFSLVAFWLCRDIEPVRLWWNGFLKHPAVAGFLGSLWGYFIGCGIVWAIRIFGTFAFGKEAMGLGDVHLMGAAGAVVGPLSVVLAFFIAPFFGLTWAGLNMFFKKIRQIPYGPFLSLGVFVVMILHEWIREHLFVFYY
ncbi:MAG: prepilin peptidase [Sedimentisphaerales bacterium]|nr:prepilin peptidase [Sedimentisphaerales bacterium]